MRGSDKCPVLHRGLEDLRSSSPCPIYMALMTGTGGGDGERDIVMAIDQWRRDC